MLAVIYPAYVVFPLLGRRIGVQAVKEIQSGDGKVGQQHTGRIIALVCIWEKGLETAQPVLDMSGFVKAGS